LNHCALYDFLVARKTGIFGDKTDEWFESAFGSAFDDDLRFDGLVLGSNPG